MKTLSNCPPLTPTDILIIKGKPMSKVIEPMRNSSVPKTEEWIYYNNKSKESYLFKNGYFIGWNSKSVFK